MFSRRRAAIPCLLVSIPLLGAAPKEQTLDDVLGNAQVVASIKTLGMVVLSQSNPKTAEHDANELRKNFWASRPDTKASPEELDLALKDFDRDFKQVVDVVRQRQLDTLHFVGMDMVLLKRSLDWYYGVATPRGPVLIRISVQYHDDAPMTIHGVKIWTDWDEVKSITREIQLPAVTKVMTITITRPSDQPSTQPAN